jgi:hypothetical protein
MGEDAGNSVLSIWLHAHRFFSLFTAQKSISCMALYRPARNRLLHGECSAK